MKKRIEVMGMVKCGEKMVKRVLGFELDVEKFVEVGTGEKVRKMVMDYVRETGLFGKDMNNMKVELKCDEFLDVWRKRRKEILTEMKKKEKEKSETEAA